MQTQITVRHFDPHPALRDYAAQRLTRLERYYDGITDARVILTDGAHHAEGKSAEIVLRVYRQTLSANSSGSSHEEAIDGCVNALRRQIKKYKAKLRSVDKDVQR